MKKSTPVCQHPTQIVLVDRSASFMDSVTFMLASRRRTRCFKDTSQAASWIKSYHSDVITDAIRVSHVLPSLSREKRTLTFDIGSIFRTAHQEKRFTLPAVVVADHDISHFNGLEFFDSIADLPCKKIMLTTYRDDPMVIDAFNQGTIDRYICKHDRNALAYLENEIFVLEREYFLNQSCVLNHVLSKDRQFYFFADAAFSELLSDLIEQHDFVEYYLYPDPAGIVFFDANGKATLLVVETNAGLLEQLEAAEDHGAPEALQAGLREERIIPFFWETGGTYTDKILDWNQYCKTAKVCTGRERYYWSLFDLPQKYQSNDIVSLNHFLNKNSQISAE